MAKVHDASGNGSRATVASIPPGTPGPSRADLRQRGKGLREKCSRRSHAGWQPPADRPDPIHLLEQSSKGRLPQLIPIRYGRMMQSPFTWYRGTALNMAADLAGTPVSGIRVQACGDAHLMNFGAFATPERRVVFDINDLDETLPAPWEWDVKRLAASFVLACRDNGFGDECARDAAHACARSYRERMAEFADMTTLHVWYSSIDAESLIPTIQDEEAKARALKRLKKARGRRVLEHDFPVLARDDDHAPKIKDNPPLTFHLAEHGEGDHLASSVRRAFATYRDSLPEYRRGLLDRFHLADIAMKVVGVGSVGTFCGILLLMAGEDDPLFLQVKQARPSVLEPYAGASLHKNHGQRIVVGCQLMQAASDHFLGWTRGQEGRQFYVRQHRDVKIKMLVDVFSRSLIIQYADLCGWTLARAHARSGEPAEIAGYLGKSGAFDDAIAEFAIAYADQSERDYEAFVGAVRSGKLEAEPD